MQARAVYDVWLEGFIVLFGVALRALVVAVFLAGGLWAIHGELDGHMSWLYWSVLAWLPLCVGLEARRITEEARHRSAGIL